MLIRLTKALVVFERPDGTSYKEGDVVEGTIIRDLTFIPSNKKSIFDKAPPGTSSICTSATIPYVPQVGEYVKMLKNTYHAMNRNGEFYKEGDIALVMKMKGDKEIYIPSNVSTHSACAFSHIVPISDVTWSPPPSNGVIYYHGTLL